MTIFRKAPVPAGQLTFSKLGSTDLESRTRPCDWEAGSTSEHGLVEDSKTVAPGSQPQHKDCRVVLVLSAIAFWTLGSVDAFSDEPRLLTGKSFRQDLEGLYAGNLPRADLRTFVNQAASDRHISIVIDRRLDTSAEFSLNLKNASLQSSLSQITQLAHGDLVVIENLVYLGPKSATTRLRTLFELRKIDMSLKEFAVPERRRSEFLRRQTFAWQDLDAPREIIESFARSNHLGIANLELIPHDLWAAATLPELSLIEALSIVLVQFDLTFQWKESGKSIELVSIPERITLERKIRPKQKLTEAIALVREHFPEIDVQTSNSDLIIKGLLEDCDAAASLLRGNASKKPGETDAAQDLRKQIFTLNTGLPVPLSALIKKLEESDIHIEYDADEMKAAGIDLEQLIQVNAEKKPAEEFFKDLFGPLRIDFRIDQTTVKLTPKKRR